MNDLGRMHVEVGGRLIEVEKLRPVQQRPGHEQLSAHAHRVAPDLQIGRLAQLDRFEAFVDPAGGHVVQPREDL